MTNRAKLKLFDNKLRRGKYNDSPLIPKSFFAPEEISQERMNICLSCEHLFKPTNSCKKCGCFMNMKTKLKDSKCPIDKWAEYIPAISDDNK